MATSRVRATSSSKEDGSTRASSSSVNVESAIRRAAAGALRRAHTTFWFYSGTTDRLLPQNTRFAAELRDVHLPHTYFVVRGGHNWALWRGNAAGAYLAASRRLAGGA